MAETPVNWAGRPYLSQLLSHPNSTIAEQFMEQPSLPVRLAAGLIVLVIMLWLCYSALRLWARLLEMFLRGVLSLLGYVFYFITLPARFFIGRRADEAAEIGPPPTNAKDTPAQPVGIAGRVRQRHKMQANQ